ncbi:transcriptional repressor LexA [Halochromatium roseum]|uniref:transcriptional repressor LexA n=1 Tax=Halochromatium roseum TaxID=391920 RepID=UPI001912A5D1|nr:transcriptional repressor LexA [Halochromatium roseum]MBK5939626.1 repressor LexA [Halochromatium roseum]
MTAFQWLIQYRRATRLDAAPELIDPHSEPMTALPLMGRVSAGQPLEAIEDPDWVQVPERLAQLADFALRVSGDSMTEDQIEDGDLILIKPQASAANGDVVVALIDGDAATVKRFYDEAGGVRLQPANAEMVPLRFAAEAVQLIGVVTAVLRQNAD